MEKKPPRPMTPFDEWTVPNELHTLKLLLPYTPAGSQAALGMLIKVIELQHTMEYFQHKKNFIQSQNFSGGFSSPLDMLEEISPYLPPEEAEMINTFRNMMNIMDMVQMMQTFSDSNEDSSGMSGSPFDHASSAEPNTSDSENTFTESDRSNARDSFSTPGGFGSGFNPMNLIMGMLSPEQQEMFEMYQTMFSQPEESGAAATESSDNDTLKAQNSSSEDESAFEVQDSIFTDDDIEETQDNAFSEDNAFETQQDHLSDDYAFQTQENNEYSNNERKDIDYE